MPSKIDIAVGRVIRERRKAAGLTLGILGRRARPKVDASQLSRIERGLGTTALGTYRGIARALGLTLGELLSEALGERRDGDGNHDHS